MGDKRAKNSDVETEILAGERRKDSTRNNFRSRGRLDSSQFHRNQNEAKGSNEYFGRVRGGGK